MIQPPNRNASAELCAMEQKLVVWVAILQLRLTRRSAQNGCKLHMLSTQEFVSFPHNNGGPGVRLRKTQGFSLVFRTFFKVGSAADVRNIRAICGFACTSHAKTLLLQCGECCCLGRVTAACLFARHPRRKRTAGPLQMGTCNESKDRHIVFGGVGGRGGSL